MNSFRLLKTCARIRGNSEQHEKLRGYCREFVEWENLLRSAEREGMTPLLKKHLEESGSDYPQSIKRSLLLLAKRHKQEADARCEVLLEVLHLLDNQGINPVVLKGAALAHTLYPDPALRPMRDIDLLLKSTDAERAQNILITSGFEQAAMPMPEDHFHLPPLFRQAGNSKICIEIHCGLYPNCPPYYPEVNVEKLLHNGRVFRIGGLVDATAMEDEEMLFYIFQHAFKMPLTYESFKLINVADIVGFLEQNVDTLDWQKIIGVFPSLYRALPLIHDLVPLSREVISKYSGNVMSVSAGAGQPFQGWPRVHFSGLDFSKKSDLLIKTFLPSEWWCRLYYGADTTAKLLRCRFLSHPRHIFWWARLYREMGIKY